MGELLKFQRDDALTPEDPDPLEAPIRPLGFLDEDYFLIDATGQFRKVSADKLTKKNIVYSLFDGRPFRKKPVSVWLAANFPPRRNRSGDPVEAWSAPDAGQWVMRACWSQGIFNLDTPIRKAGMFRLGDPEDPESGAVCHTGEMLVFPDGRVEKAGQSLAGTVYAAASGGRKFDLEPRVAGADDAPWDPEVMFEFRDRLRSDYAWQQEFGPEVWLGHVALSVLGAFPRWRAHMSLTAKSQSGKSTLVQLAVRLMGPMCRKPMADVTAAYIRQSMGGRGFPLVLDEQESGARDQQMMELLRLMSGGDDVEAGRGGAGGAPTDYKIEGAVSIYGITAPEMDNQDVNRMIRLSLGPRPDKGDDIAAAMAKDALLRDARAIGARLWRRMLARTPQFDRAFLLCSELVKSEARKAGLESRDRSGDTIGSVLAAWWALTGDGEITADDLEEMRPIAAEMVASALSAVAEGVGGGCWWDWLLQHRVGLSRGDVLPVATLVRRALRAKDPKDDDLEWANSRLEPFGIRYAPPGSRMRSGLYVAVRHRQLEQIFANTKWVGGRHVGELVQSLGVRRTEIIHDVRILGKKTPCVAVPESMWPEPAERGEAVVDPLA